MVPVWQMICADMAGDLWPVWQDSRDLCGTWMFSEKLPRTGSPVVVFSLNNDLLILYTVSKGLL